MIVTELKNIKISRGCKKNPVYISWLNTLGGYDHWLFEKVQIKSQIVGNDSTSNSYITDLANARGQVFDTSRTNTPTLTVFTNALIEDIEGLKTIMYSLNVEMLMNPNEWNSIVKPIWQRIRPQIGTFKLYGTNETRSNLEITFELPYTNIQ